MTKFIPRHDLTQPLDLAPAGPGAEWIAAGVLLLTLIAICGLYWAQSAYDKDTDNAYSHH